MHTVGKLYAHKEKGDGGMWFFVVVVLVIVVVVAVKKGGKDVRDTPQYKTFREILDALEEAGFEASEFRFEKNMTSTIRINGQKIGQIWCSGDGYAVFLRMKKCLQDKSLATL
ncbi:MAG: hypothetical protein FWC93_06270 [Defluviitaleaceae bacterium]|nr:hypothetical protein [Defluviitaleaceae bacterium]